MREFLSEREMDEDAKIFLFLFFLQVGELFKNQHDEHSKRSQQMTVRLFS